MDQLDYVGELTAAPVDSNLKDAALVDKKGHHEFRGNVFHLLWAAGMTRPDISFDVAVVSGATNALTVANAEKAAKVVKKAKRSKVFLLFPRITGPVVMIVYCDSTCVNLSYGKTGCGIFLALAAFTEHGGNEVFCPIGWSSKRLRGLVRSTFAGEMLTACSPC